MRKGVSLEVNLASLPRDGQNLGCVSLDAFVGVAEHQLHTT